MFFRSILICFSVAALLLSVITTVLSTTKDCSSDDSPTCGLFGSSPFASGDDGDAGMRHMRKRFLPKYLLELSSSGATNNRRHLLLPRLSNQIFGTATATVAAADDAPEGSGHDVDAVGRQEDSAEAMPKAAAQIPEDEPIPTTINSSKTNEVHQSSNPEEQQENNIDKDNNKDCTVAQQKQQQQRQQQIRDASPASVRQQHRRDINAWMVGSSGGGDVVDATRSSPAIVTHQSPSSSPAAHQLMLLGSVGRFDAAALGGGRRRNAVRLEKFISRPCYFSPVQCLLHIPDKKLANFFEVMARPSRNAEPLVAVDFEETRSNFSVDSEEKGNDSEATTVDTGDHHVDDLFITASSDPNGVADSHQRKKLLVFQVPTHHQQQSSSVGGAGSGALAIAEAAASVSTQRNGGEVHDKDKDDNTDTSLNWRRRKSHQQQRISSAKSEERPHQRRLRHFVVPICGTTHLGVNGGKLPLPTPVPAPTPPAAQHSNDGAIVPPSPPPPPITNSWTRFGSSRWRLLTRV